MLCEAAAWRETFPREKAALARLWMDSPPDCHAGGRGFKSRLSRQNFHTRETSHIAGPAPFAIVSHQRALF